MYLLSVERNNLLANTPDPPSVRDSHKDPFETEAACRQLIKPEEGTFEIEGFGDILEETFDFPEKREHLTLQQNLPERVVARQLGHMPRGAQQGKKVL